jgi:hypothetical protein
VKKTLIIFLISILGFSCATAQDKEKLQLKDGERTLFTYNAKYVPSPVPEKPFYGRSGYIHPVLSPSGKIVTDEFPEDHMHQHALMFAWTSAVIEGRKADFWNSPKKQGKIEHVETVSVSVDKIVVKLRHIDLTGGKETPLIIETWEITRVPHKELNVFDLKSTQNCIAEKPIKIAKYHYGGMCIRGNAGWLKEMSVTTNEGKSRKDANHSRPNWVAMSGNVDGVVCGIAGMSHPSNFRAPQPVRVHPSKPYFCFAPMVLGDFEIAKGKPYISTFRFVTFDGEPEVEKLNELYKSFNGK